MNQSVQRELQRIRLMPYGVARIAAAEAISRRIEAEGPKESLAEALLDQVEAYTFAGQAPKSFVTFARLLRLWDESPGLFDEGDEHNLFWEFKWIAADLPDFPQITAAQAEAFLDDMRRRFELAGHGISSVRMSRFKWAWHAGQPGAEPERMAWVTGLRDDFEDCRACTIGSQVAYFTELARYDEAVRLGLTQDSSCNLEPTITHHSVALAALLTGDAELALARHRLALAASDNENRDIAPARGQAFELLARGGHLERALRRLRNDDAELLKEAPSPLSRLRFLHGVLAGLSASLAEAPERGAAATGLADPAHGTVASLHAWVRGEAQTLTSAFDARNGTDYYAGLLQRALDALPAENPLRFGAEQDRASTDIALAPGGTAAAQAGAAGATCAADTADADSSDPEASVEDPAARFSRAEALAAAGRAAEAHDAYLSAARASEQAGRLDDAGLAYAEAAQCSASIGEEEAAHASFALAVPRLVAGEADPEIRVAVLTAWAPVAARMAELAELLDALLAELDGYAEFDGIGLSEELDERLRRAWLQRRAALRDTLARSLASAPSQQRPQGLDVDRAAAEAMAAGEEFAGIGRIDDAAHAFWLAGRIQRENGDAETALWSLESAFEGFTAAGDRDNRVRAAGELIKLLRSTGREERADEVVAQL